MQKITAANRQKRNDSNPLWLLMARLVKPRFGPIRVSLKTRKIAAPQVLPANSRKQAAVPREKPRGPLRNSGRETGI